MSVELSIVVPTYKEAENLPLLIAEIREALLGHVTYQIIVVDDNSPDGTAEICDRLAREGEPLKAIIRRNERGLSSAVIRGMEEARTLNSEFVAVMDADLSHPPSAIPEMLRLVKANTYQLVIGSRYVPGGATDAAWGLFRWLNSKVATLLATPFSGGAKDPMAGFFLMRIADFQQRDPLNPIGYKILLEIICKCRLTRVGEVPIFFRDRRLGQSKLNFKEQLRYLRHLYRLYEYKYTLFYEITRFLTVGATGLIIDLASMHLVHYLLAQPMTTSRAAGISVAILWNFYWNREVTFPRSRAEFWGIQFLKYLLGCGLGGLLNWTTSLTAFTSLPWFQSRMARSAILGVLAATTLNFLMAKFFAFRRRGESSP